MCQRGQPTTTLPEAYCAPSDYSGTISTTKGGHVCKGWATVPGFEWVGDHNRCRATSFQNNSAWCYVDGAGLTWDYCVLPEPRQCASRCSGMTLSKEIVALAVEDLEGRGWGNGSTSYVQFEFNVYNWNDKILGLLQVPWGGRGGARGWGCGSARGGGRGMHWKGRHRGGSPGSRWMSGWRRLPKRLRAVTVGYKCH